MSLAVGVNPSHRLFILFAVTGPLEAFRQPEIESLCQLLDIDYSWPEVPDASRPYVLIGLPGVDEAKQLGGRLIAVKHIWEYWARAGSYDELHEQVKSAEGRALWEPYLDDKELTWKFTVAGHNRTIPTAVQLKTINTFSYLPLPGRIDLKKPKLEIGVFEEYEFDKMRGAKIRRMREEMEAAAEASGAAGGEDKVQDKGTEKSKALELALEEDKETVGPMRAVWMGRKVCDTQRHLIDHFDLKKRAYIGTTSMEAEVSLLMANQALAAPGKWVYDPFVGTGSMLLTAAGFGALAFGSDIDGRQIRGKKTGIRHSAEQYGVSSRIVDTCCFDMTQHPWRTGGMFDAIVTDPPYGVRAGAKRIGREGGEKQPRVVPGRESEGFHHQFEDYVPPSVGWPMEEVISTLVTYSLYLLKPGGRLVFFLPTDNAEYQDVDIPSIPGLKLVSNSSQSFGKWARRLITMEKEHVEEGEWRKAIDGLDRGIRREGQKSVLEVEREREGEEEERRRPGHADFHRRFAAGFVPLEDGVQKLALGEGAEEKAQ
ncbi:hypothetical protein JCM10213_007230 [Rhodosporidiobolus nylandii]